MPVELQPTSVIKAHLGLEPNGRVQKFFVEECAKAMDRYVPMRRGELRKYYIQGNNIVYDQEYAKYQYYGIRGDGTHAIDPEKRDRSKHPLATSYWDEKMWTAHGTDITQRIQKRFFGGK